MIINNITDLKGATKDHTITAYVVGNSDLGIFKIRFDERSDRFILVNTLGNWTLGIKTKELFEGSVVSARAIGAALLGNKLIIIGG